MGYKILAKTELCPNQYELTIEAPYIVRNAQAGQFIIFRAEENGERVPLTIADVNKVHAGKSSVKLYNYVADILGEKPENIAVFEDIYVGLKTAYENGFLSIAVDDVNSRKDNELKQKYSHLFIKSFEDMM